MSDATTRGKSSAMGLRISLLVTAILVMLGSCGLALYWALSHVPVTGNVILVASGILLTGLGVAVLLIVIAVVLGMFAALVARHEAAPVYDLHPTLDRMEQTLRVLHTMQSRTEAPLTIAPVSPDGVTAHLLEQLRDLTLMNEAQRARYAERHWAQRKQMHQEAMERDVLVGDWVAAFARLEELQIVMPGDPQMAELRERVESEQMARLEEEVRLTQGRLRQLMGATLWQQAEEVAAALQTKYPGKAEPQRLVEEVRKEHEAYERESMERLFHDISGASDKRQWRTAIMAVEEFIRRYPLDPRAEALRMDLPTLKENAAAQERKEAEEVFKDMLKRQRYEEAIQTAKSVIAKYPLSATATELTRLLPKVEELARQEAARVASQVPNPTTVELGA